LNPCFVRCGKRFGTDQVLTRCHREHRTRRDAFLHCVTRRFKSLLESEHIEVVHNVQYTNGSFISNPKIPKHVFELR
jgi:hypothetical protein